MSFLFLVLIGRMSFSYIPVSGGINVPLNFPYLVPDFKINTFYLNYSKLSFGISLLAGEKISFRKKVGRIYSVEDKDSVDLVYNFQNNLDLLRCSVKFKPVERLPFYILMETDVSFSGKAVSREGIEVHRNDTVKVVTWSEYFISSPFLMKFALSYKLLDLPLNTQLTVQAGNIYVRYLNPLPERKIKTSFNYPFFSLSLTPSVKTIGDDLPREIPFIVGMTSIGMSLFLTGAPYINDVSINERILWGTGAVLSSFGSAYLLSLYKKREKRNIISNICAGLITGVGWCFTSSLIRDRVIKYWEVSGDYMVREFGLFVIYGGIVISHIIASFI